MVDIPHPSYSTREKNMQEPECICLHSILHLRTQKHIWNYFYHMTDGTIPPESRNHFQRQHLSWAIELVTLIVLKWDPTLTSASLSSKSALDNRENLGLQSEKDSSNLSPALTSSSGEYARSLWVSLYTLSQSDLFQSNGSIFQL